MFILTTRFSKKRAVLLLLLLSAVGVLLFFLLHRPTENPASPPPLKDNDDRIAYLEALGWKVAPEPLETLQLLLPEPLPENYLPYNQIQLAQGFDLNNCCGKQLTRYTYQILNYPHRPDGVQLNLYLCDDRVAAGDVIASGAHGFQSGLLFPGTAATDSGAPQ